MEEIKNGEKLYRYAKPSAFPEGQKEIPTVIFNDRELSCDWERYQKAPEKSFHIAQGKEVVIEITVCEDIKNPTNPKRSGEIITDWKQDIIHDPSKSNKSHSLIKGKKKSAVTSVIRDNSKIIHGF